MTTYYINHHERYPVYDLADEDRDQDRYVIEITDEERADYDDTWQKWIAWQQRLGEHIDPDWVAEDAKP